MPTVKHIKITDANHQRLDNWLLRELKGVPKSRIYRAIRKAEIKVNGRRTQAEYRLQNGDEVRLPPLRVAEKPESAPISANFSEILEKTIIHEDKDIIIMNKPSGIAVHGGSGISKGIVEGLRQIRPLAKRLELAHRIDRDTSGCLILGKKSSIVQELHAKFAERRVKKGYLLVVHGVCDFEQKVVEYPLERYQLKSGERRVKVSDQGKSAKTVFKVITRFERASLLRAEPETGRTHQLRVHAAQIGHPIVGDEKYGHLEQDGQLAGKLASRLFLHASELQFKLKDNVIALCATLDPAFLALLRYLNEKV